jgi:hypothetical protein
MRSADARWIACLVLVGLAFGCGCDRIPDSSESGDGVSGGSESALAAPDLSRTAADLSVREHVFRAMLAQSAGPGDVCFLSFGWDENRNWLDPPGGFVERLSDLELVIRPASRAGIRVPSVPDSARGPVAIGDTVSGMRGAVYWVSVVSWIDDGHVRVSAGRYDGSSAGRSYTTSVKWRRDHWRMSTPVSHWLR